MATLRLSPEQREKNRLRHIPPLKCADCSEELGKSSYAYVTFHDQRSCVHLCFYHAEKRLTYSVISGHSQDCPYHHEPHAPEAA
jgi:hypothetical protein